MTAILGNRNTPNRIPAAYNRVLAHLRQPVRRGCAAVGCVAVSVAIPSTWSSDRELAYC